MKSIILAGGIGTRLWPLSREYYPKQFIKIGELSLFQQSCKRALKLSEEIFVVTNEIHQYLVRDQMEEIDATIDEQHLVLEKVGRGTLPAIISVMKRIEGIAIILPSDHLLSDDAIEQIKASESLANDHLITFGIHPTFPHTGYGYIKYGGNWKVEDFKEKPDKDTAKKYIESGYLWNSGMFMFSRDIFFEEVKKHCPDYEGIESISIDKGILEKSDKVLVIPLNVIWSDLGTFGALFDSGKHDSNGNVGKADYINSSNNYVCALKKHVGLIGVNNLVVVDTPDALLVCDNQQTERVKELVGLYKGEPIAKFHRKVYRKWGSYTILEESPFYKIKRVSVKCGRELSLQFHLHRSEHWVVVSGTAEIIIGDKTTLLCKGESIFVGMGIKHRLKNPGLIPLEVIEVQIGEYLEEDDIVRIEK